ncbi:Abi family protein [Akkermansiaceae bacterium]|nr:Abi family protein [Akkermansiaceae bacterium]
MTVEDEPAALDYLERIGFYRLSGYWYPFRKMKEKPVGLSFREDEFIKGSRFEEAVELYVFDKNLRLLALDALERIEMAVRVDVAYLLGKYDAFAHHDAQYFDGNFTTRPVHRYGGATGFDLWHTNYQKLLKRARNEPFVAHNMSKQNKLPIWVAIEIFDFGTLSRLYSGMRKVDRIKIADKYELSEKDLRSLLRSLNFIRNVSAHHSRLWNIVISEKACKLKFDSHWGKLEVNHAFYYFCVMQYLLQKICPKSNWHQRFKLHLKTFPNMSINTASISDFGLNLEIDSWELWK